MGKILLFAGADSNDGERGRMPRPLVVVHSGKTQMIRLGCSRASCAKVVSDSVEGGLSSGGKSARRILWKSVVRCSSLELGYETVKTGSKIAAI